MPKYKNIKNGLVQTMKVEDFKKLPALRKSKYKLIAETEKSKPTTAKVEKPKS